MSPIGACRATIVPDPPERDARDLLLDQLTVVRGSAQTLLAREPSPAVRTQLLQAIIEASDVIERTTLGPVRPRA